MLSQVLYIGKSSSARGVVDELERFRRDIFIFLVAPHRSLVQQRQPINYIISDIKCQKSDVETSINQHTGGRCAMCAHTQHFERRFFLILKLIVMFIFLFSYRRRR